MNGLVFQELGAGETLVSEHDGFLAMRQHATPDEVADFRVEGYQPVTATHGEKSARAAWRT